jgi:hypothetical protein
MFDEKPAKIKAGIKHPAFRTVSGSNGKSHKKNAARKRASYLKNRQIRSDTNARRSSMSPTEYHMVLRNLSEGRA